MKKKQCTRTNKQRYIFHFRVNIYWRINSIGGKFTKLLLLFIVGHTTLERCTVHTW